MLDEKVKSLKVIDDQMRVRVDKALASDRDTINTMDAGKKADLLNDQVTDFKRLIKMFTVKFDKVDEKIKKIQEEAEDFDKTALKLEKLYLRDISKRKEYFANHEKVKKALEFQTGYAPNIDSINKIFDDIIAEEQTGYIGTLFRLPNLLMLAVIGLSAFIMVQLNKLGGPKGRKE